MDQMLSSVAEGVAELANQLPGGVWVLAALALILAGSWVISVLELWVPNEKPPAPPRPPHG